MPALLSLPRWFANSKIKLWITHVYSIHRKLFHHGQTRWMVQHFFFFFGQVNHWSLWCVKLVVNWQFTFLERLSDERIMYILICITHKHISQHTCMFGSLCYYSFPFYFHHSNSVGKETQSLFNVMLWLNDLHYWGTSCRC